MKKLNYVEMGYLVMTFFLFLFNPSFGQSTSVADWVCRFKPEARDLFDRYCRFTDGAGSDRYSVNKLMQLLNQNLLYSILQPKEPNDVGLFSKIRQAIEATGNVSFRLESTLERIITTDQKVSAVIVNGERIDCDRVLLCVPPVSIYRILVASGIVNASIERLMTKSSYDMYLSATFHWDTPITIPDVWGFPTSDWGLISIPVSKYYTDRSKTIMSTTCFYLDRVSRVSGLTANQTSDPNLVMEEMFRQLKESYPSLPRPTVMLLSPIDYYANGRWQSRDSGFVKSVGEPFVGVDLIENVYQIGTQNGNSSFAYTTFESAVTNAIEWYNTVPGVERVVVKKPVRVNHIVYGLVLLFVLVRVFRAKTAKSSSLGRL